MWRLNNKSLSNNIKFRIVIPASQELNQYDKRSGFTKDEVMNDPS